MPDRHSWYTEPRYTADHGDGGMQRVTPGASDPDGVLILHGQKRAGNAIKERYLTHLSQLFAEGYMNQAEHAARISYLQEHPAMTEAMLRNLIDDLPPLPAPLPRTREAAISQLRKIRWEALGGRARLAIMAAGVVAGFCAIFVSIVVLASVKHIHIPLAVGGTVSIVTGAGLVVTCIVFGCLDEKIQRL